MRHRRRNRRRRRRHHHEKRMLDITLKDLHDPNYLRGLIEGSEETEEKLGFGHHLGHTIS